MPVPPFLWFLALIVYIFLVWASLQNDQLVGIYKWLFSLGFVPMFLFLMFANIWIADHVFPHIIEWHRTEWHKLWIEDYDIFKGFSDRRIQTLVAFLITSLIPIGICWAWYRFLVRLSRRKLEASSSSFKRARRDRGAA
jgi:hypothetical protein